MVFLFAFWSLDFLFRRADGDFSSGGSDMLTSLASSSTPSGIAEPGGSSTIDIALSVSRGVSEDAVP